MDKELKMLFDKTKNFDAKSKNKKASEAMNLASAIGEESWRLAYNYPSLVNVLLKELAWVISDSEEFSLKFLENLKDYNEELFED